MRRLRDSNPGYPLEYGSFQDCCNQPLCQASVDLFNTFFNAGAKVLQSDEFTKPKYKLVLKSPPFFSENPLRNNITH